MCFGKGSPRQSCLRTLACSSTGLDLENWSSWKFELNLDMSGPPHLMSVSLCPCLCALPCLQLPSCPSGWAAAAWRGAEFPAVHFCPASGFVLTLFEAPLWLLRCLPSAGTVPAAPASQIFPVEVVRGLLAPSSALLVGSQPRWLVAGVLQVARLRGRVLLSRGCGHS